MKFEIIDNRELDLAGKGYKWANEPSQVDQAVLDDIRRTRGENYVDCLSDDLLDGYSPICRGDDGELYSVLFDYGGDAPRAAIWSKVAKRCRLPEELEILSVHGKIGDFCVYIGLGDGGRWEVFIGSMRMTSCASLKNAIEYVNERGWMKHVERFSVNAFEITHWMPFPEAPTEEER